MILDSTLEKNFLSAKLSLLSEIFIILLGGWGLAQNLTYILGQSLFINFLISIPIWAGILILLRRFPRNTSQQFPDVYYRIEWSKKNTYLLVLSVIFFLFSYATKNLFLYWITILMAIILLLVKFKNSHTTENSLVVKKDSKESQLSALLLIGLIVVVIIFSLAANRPDKDDSQYLSVSARAAEAPLDGYNNDLPNFPPGMFENVHRFREWASYLYFIGFSSWILDLEPIEISSFIVTPLGAALVVISYAVLFRKLFPDYWLEVLFLTVGIFLIDGSAHRVSANFAFVRIWEGKSILFHVLRPLIIYYSFSFGENPNYRYFILLFLCNVVGIGLSSTGIWLTPFLTMAGGIAGMLFAKKNSLKVFFGLILSSVYPLIIGASEFVNVLSNPRHTQRVGTWFEGLQRGFVSPTENYTWWYAGFLLLFLFLAPTVRAQILGLVTTFIFFGIFMNPVVAPYAARYITHIDLYYRTPFLVFLVPFAAWSIAYIPWRLRLKSTYKIIALVLMLVSFSFVVPTKYIFSERNNVSFSLPRVKIAKTPYLTSLEIMKRLDRGANIAAVSEISWFLPTFRGGYYPILPRLSYLDKLTYTREYNAQDIFFRANLDSFINGNSVWDVGFFSKALQYFDLKAIVVSKNHENVNELNAYLVSKNFKQYYFTEYVLWIEE